MTSTRDQFIETTCSLLEAQGYHATGLNQIIKESGAPKGSLYYHFPAGKEELVEAAIERSAREVTARIEANLREDGSAAVVIARFVRRVADGVEASGYRSGGPLMTVAMETATSSERLNLACRAAYDQLVAAFAARLVRDGFVEERAGELATFIVASIEGGIVLSRTNHSGDALRRVADELAWMLDRAKG